MDVVEAPDRWCFAQTSQRRTGNVSPQPFGSFLAGFDSRDVLRLTAQNRRAVNVTSLKEFEAWLGIRFSKRYWDMLLLGHALTEKCSH